MEFSTVNQLIPPRLKIDRAKKHLSELEAVIREHIRSNPYRLICDLKEAPSIKSPHADFVIPAHLAYHYHIAKTAPLPDETRLIFGDVVHNLRAALDLLAYDLISANGGDKKRSFFPFHEEARNFENALSEGQISVVPKEIKDLLRTEIQPYRGGKGDAIWRMNKLDNIDKHRLLLATEDITGLEDAEFFGDSRLIMGRIENRYPGGYLAITTDPLVSKDETRLTVEVVIAEREYFPDANLTKTLGQLTADTLGVVEKFERTLFGATGTS